MSQDKVFRCVAAALNVAVASVFSYRRHKDKHAGEGNLAESLHTQPALEEVVETSGSTIAYAVSAAARKEI